MAENSASAIVHESTITTIPTTTTATTSAASTTSTLKYGTNSLGCAKPDIKVTADGVAKFNFSFLDELQGGDSSLEPGEVVTPPHSVSPVPATPAKILTAIKAPSKLADVRTTSQTEAQVCEEKVRAILELDAIKRREEIEKRKQDLEKRRQSGELEREEEEKRKAKAERKRIKKIEKEQRAARLALMSDDNDEHRGGADDTLTQRKKSARNSEDRESGERVSSSEEENGGNDSPTLEEESKRSAVTSVAVLAGSTSIYHSPLPSGHLSPFPDAYGNNSFRAMNMFPRNIRPDFYHSRGIYLPRGRGVRGIGNSMRFPLYRVPFYGGNVAGSLQLRNHGLPHSQRGAPSSRGHSPIQVPPIDLKWTRTQPAVSYSPKWDPERKSTSGGKEKISSSPAPTTLTLPIGEDIVTKNTNKREKSRKKIKKEKKAKSKEKEKEKEKEKRSLHSKNHDKSSLRKIAKIRKTFENRSHNKQEPHADFEIKTTMSVIEQISKYADTNSSNEKRSLLHLSEENRQTTNVEVINDELSSDKVSDIKFGESFDIFADSPPHNNPSKAKTNSIKADIEFENNMYVCTRRSCTPPIELLRLSVSKKDNKAQINEKTPLQKAIEMQQRIGKLLQDDDLQSETLEATKEKLLQTTQKLSHHHVPVVVVNSIANTDITLNTTTNSTTPNVSSTTSTLDNIVLSEKRHRETQKKHHETSEHLQSGDKSEKSNGSLSKYVNPFKRSCSRGRDTKRHRSQGEHKSPIPSNKISRSSVRQRSRSRPESSPIRQHSVARDYSRGTSQTRSKSRHRDRSRRREDPHSNTRDAKRKGSQSPSNNTNRDQRNKSHSRNPTINRLEAKDTSKEHCKSVPYKVKGSTTDTEKSTIHGSAMSFHKKRSIVEQEKKLKQHETKAKKLKQTKHTLLSFNASEFLFPDVEENSSEMENLTKRENDKFKLNAQGESQDDYDDDDTTASSSAPNKICSIESNKHNSPDTDDYMDNWELDDPDSSNTAAEPSVAKSISNLETCDSVKENDELLARYKNPSPLEYTVALPIRSLQPQQQSQISSTMITSTNEYTYCKTSKTLLKPLLPPRNELALSTSYDAGVAFSASNSGMANINVAEAETKTGQANEERFPMQDIYNEFIKSVQATGVDITASDAIKKNLETSDATSQMKRVGKRNLSTSSSSSSSSSSSNSSSTSSDSSGSSASSASNTSCPPPIVSCAAETPLPKNELLFAKENFTEKSENIPPTIKIESEITTPPSQNTVSSNTLSPSLSQEVKIETTGDSDSSTCRKFLDGSLRYISSSDPVAVLESVLPSQPTEAQKTQIAKDLKRVKSYDANLKRTQLMRSNFDSSEDIFSELAKMEKLFLHAIKFIIQKYTSGQDVSLQIEGGDDMSKPTFVLAITKSIPQKDAEIASHTPNKTNGQFVQSLRETTPQPILETVDNSAVDSKTNRIFSIEEQAPASEAVNIFDSNRETIKLTIAPLKLSKTSAIFDKLVKPTDGGGRSRSSSVATGEDADFTETLVKTTKEIAIVKPISKGTQSPSPHRNSSRRLSPKLGRPQTPRIGRGRRSSSRSGSGSAYRSNEYRSRRSNSHTRHGIQKRGRPKTLSVSPQRREGHSRHDSPKRGRGKNMSPIRYRSGERRSRSPIRRPQSKRDFSPFSRRRRAAIANSGDMRGARFNDMRSYSRSHSRSRSPSAYHYRFGGRTHGPRLSISSGHRRSYSRDKYSRSPLPFKPPSPPMRHSPEQDGEDTRRSRSFSRSPSSPRKVPRSPPFSRSRSPQSPRSPRSPISPRSPRSPRPRTPPVHYNHHHREGSYEVFRPHSPPEQHSYFSVQPNMGTVDATMGICTPATPADFYYDAGMGLNGSETGQRNQPVYNAYETTYNQYPGASSGGYLHHGMQAAHSVGMDVGANVEYYENHFMPSASVNSMMPNAMSQPMYSANMIHPNIHPGARPYNYYFNNQVPVQMQPPQPRQPQPQIASTSLLKELPKATIAVQKGNVLEIVPSELSHSPAIATFDEKILTNKTEPIAASQNEHPTKLNKPIDPLRDEILQRLQLSAKLKESRKIGGVVTTAKTSILKKSTVQLAEEVAEETATPIAVTVMEDPVHIPVKNKRKKVLFEDGLFPDRDSDDEDSKDAEKMLRSEVRRMRKMGRKAATVLYLLSTRKPNTKQKPTMGDLGKLAPPPPPPQQPLPHLEQPVSNRPPTPPRFIFYHYDAVVHALYTSPSEQGIPPRLTDPKAAAAFAASKVSGIGAMVRPRCSPIFAIKRDPHPSSINTLKLIGNSQSRGSASPQMTQSQFYGPRRINISFNKHQPPPYQQAPFSSAHQINNQRYGNCEAAISTLSTQPLSQTKSLHKPMVATFQPIIANSPQMPATLAPPLGQGPQQQHLVKPTTPVCFTNNIDIRATPPQHPPVFTLPPHPGSIVAHPHGFQPQRLMFSPNITQTPMMVNGATGPSPTSSSTVMRQPQSYAYHPYVPQSPIRPPSTQQQKNAILTQQPRAAQPHFNVFP